VLLLTPAFVSLRELAAVSHTDRTDHVRRFICGEPRNRTVDFLRNRPSAEQAHFRAHLRNAHGFGGDTNKGTLTLQLIGALTSLSGFKRVAATGDLAAADGLFPAMIRDDALLRDDVRVATLPGNFMSKR